MKTIVVYSSQYGATEQYARWLAEALDADLYAVRAISADVLGGYDCILYGGGLYAGGVKGLPTFLKHFSKCEGKPLILFTCGIADPKDPSECRTYPQPIAQGAPSKCRSAMHLFPPARPAGLPTLNGGASGDDGHAPEDALEKGPLFPAGGGPPAPGNLRQGREFYRPLRNRTDCVLCPQRRGIGPLISL